MLYEHLHIVYVAYVVYLVSVVNAVYAVHASEQELGPVQALETTLGDSKNTVRGDCLDIPRFEESLNN